ncbi:MAG TPA: response regulator [Acidimicrobiales bacterium]|nr:response regulator [Acidimicrobiales bacterium]
MSRVLFVDDDAAVLDELRDLFKPQRLVWDLEFATGAGAALDLMTKAPVDVVIAHRRLPAPTGREFLAEVRVRFPDAARVMLAERSDHDDLAHTIGLAHQFVLQPYLPDELIDAIRRALRLRDQVGTQKVRSEISDIAMLPTPSPVFANLLNAIESPNGDAHLIGQIVSHDVGLTAKVLQLVNSSYFAPRTRITSVDNAVVRLGSSVIRTLAFLDEVHRDINDPLPVQFWVAELASHTYAVADLARLLAPRELADDVFCGGLLHECGQLVFARCRPDMFCAHLDERVDANRSLSELEREAWGVTHAQAGAYLLNLWGCPIDVIDAVAHHDDDELSRNDRVQIVQVAHRLIEATGTSLCGRPHPEPTDFRWLDYSDYAEQAYAWLDARAAAIATPVGA